MTRWTKSRIARIEGEKLDREIANGEHEGLSERELDRLLSERTEDTFGELSDRLYDEKRDRDMERDRDIEDLSDENNSPIS